MNSLHYPEIWAYYSQQRKFGEVESESSQIYPQTCWRAGGWRSVSFSNSLKMWRLF